MPVKARQARQAAELVAIVVTSLALGMVASWEMYRTVFSWVALLSVGVALISELHRRHSKKKPPSGPTAYRQ